MSGVVITFTHPAGAGKHPLAGAVAEGLGVRALLRRFVSRAPIYAGRGLQTDCALESGGAPPHSTAFGD